MYHFSAPSVFVGNFFSNSWNRDSASFSVGSVGMMALFGAIAVYGDVVEEVDFLLLVLHMMV